MSWLSWLVVLFASVLLIPGAFSIDVGFSAGSGGESTDLSSSYDVDTGVSVSEESTTSPDQATIENTRSVSGTGDINAVQTYSGSEGYAWRCGLDCFRIGISNRFSIPRSQIHDGLPEHSRFRPRSGS